MNRYFAKAACVAAAFVVMGSTAAAQSQPNGYYTDWVEYYYNAGVNAHFYYSPRSIYRIGDLRQVEWTDSSPKGAYKIVFLVHIDCTKRTIQSRIAKRYDASSNAFIDATDLSQNAPVEGVTPGSMADRLVNAVC